ncbi:MAG: MFS transporter [Coriobacteriia bacterium]|nr:MFS transporter [Coriobacteriia bacterium]
MSVKSENLLFANLCATCVILALLATALNTALPAIGLGLGVDDATVQWLVSGYALALAVFMPATGYLATRFPSRPLYLAAVALFCLCCAACALSSNFPLIMLARIGQAATNALVSNLTQVSIMRMFPKEQRGVRMGWFGLSVGFAPVVAPALGGLIVDTLGWRALFALVGCAALLCLLAAFLLMKNTFALNPKKMDVPSFGLSIFVFGGLAIGLGQLPSKGLLDPASIIAILLGLAASFAFVPRQLRAQDPFLNLRLLKRESFARAVLGSSALYALMMGGAAVLPLYLQGDLGCSASVAGLAVLPAALLMALVSPVAGKIFDVCGMPLVAFASMLLLLVGNLLMCVPGLNESVFWAAFCASLRYAGIGFAQMPLVTWGNNSVCDKDMPQATAMLTTSRNVFVALGVAVFVGVLNSAGLEFAFASMAALSSVLLVACKKENS